MYHHLSCEAYNFLDSQEILRISWNLKTHYRVHGNLSGVRQLCQINPVHVLVSYFFKSTLILLSRQGFLSTGLFPLGFFTKTPTHILFFLIRATPSAHLILPNLTNRITFGEE
jgi:hypothetical protein